MLWRMVSRVGNHPWMLPSTQSHALWYPAWQDTILRVLNRLPRLTPFGSLKKDSSTLPNRILRSRLIQSDQCETSRERTCYAFPSHSRTSVSPYPSSYDPSWQLSPPPGLRSCSGWYLPSSSAETVPLTFFLYFVFSDLPATSPMTGGK